MDVNGVAVMRRQNDGWLNATQILKVAGVEKGRRTKILEKEIQTGEHEKVQGGYGKYQGTWIPFDRGLQVCEQYGVKDTLLKLLTHNRNADGGAGDVDTPTKEQAMAAQRKRMYTSSQENRTSGLSGTFFKNISATASHAVAAISKARFDSPGPRNRSGQTRAPSFNRQSSMNQELNDFPSNSQQSFVSDYGQNGESAYGSQTTQPMNGDGMDQPPRKRQRVLTPANSFGGLTPTYPPIDSYNGAFPGSPTEPNESFIYSQAGLNADLDRPYGPIPLRPLPHEVSPEADARRGMLMNLFLHPDGPSEEQCRPLRDMIPQEIDIPLDAQSHTALHWAATLARMPLLKVLIHAGSSPFRVNAGGETALMKVVTVTNSMEQNCFTEILDLLGGTIDVVDDKGRTILHHIAFTSAIKGRSAASKYYLESLLEWVVRQGSAPNSQALPNGNNGAARMGIGRFMSEIVNAQDNAGDTALNVAARVGMRSIVSQLIEVGADPNIANNVGLKPTDFGIGREPMDVANGENGANGNGISQQPSQNSKGNSDDVLNCKSSPLLSLSSDTDEP
jgi:regulatory protein SWI6